ncbi:MAG: hypothetical protein QOE53_457, partial [Pseudonocardiales bacterium]|nr:hypothetical protein [Pseudonocardiales bacterium]
AAHHVYDAECALHYAHQAARGAAAGEEACQCDRWVAAAYTHLHAANVEYAAATAAVDVVAARGPALHAVPAPPAVPAQVVQVHAVPVHAVQVHAVQVPAIEPRAAAG